MDLSFTKAKRTNLKSNEEVKLLFNSLEDCAYYYMNANDTDEKQQLLEYFQSTTRFILENKGEIDVKLRKDNRIFKVLKDRKRSLMEIDEYAAAAITDTATETVINFANYIKGSDSFYCVHQNGGADISSGVGGSFDDFTKIEQKSVKVENMGKYFLYMISGMASEDYKKNPNQKNYKEKCESALGINMDRCNPYGFDAEVNGLDGVKYTLEATSNTSTETQRIKKLLQRGAENNSEIIHLSTGYFCSDYTEGLQYRNRKAMQHGTPFFVNLGSQEIERKEICNLNLLPFMSLIDHVSINYNDDIKISDFTKINPLVVGSDTYETYKVFRDIQVYIDPIERTEKFLSYCLEYGNEVVNTLNKLHSPSGDYLDLDQKTKSILKNTSYFLTGVFEKFNNSNLKGTQPTLTQKILIVDMFTKFDDIVDRFENPPKVDMIFSDIAMRGIDGLNDKYKILNDKIKKRDKGIIKKPELSKESSIGARSFQKIKKIINQNNPNMSDDDIDSAMELINFRQKHNNQTYFLALKGADIAGINKQKFKHIRDSISNITDFNDLQQQESFANNLETLNPQLIFSGDRVNDERLDASEIIQQRFAKLLKTYVNTWEDKHGKSYQINDSTFFLLEELEDQKFNCKMTRKILRDGVNDAIFRKINDLDLSLSGSKEFNASVLNAMGFVELYNEPRLYKDAFVDLATMNNKLTIAIAELNEEVLTKKISKKNIHKL